MSVFIMYKWIYLYINEDKVSYSIYWAASVKGKTWGMHLVFGVGRGV